MHQLLLALGVAGRARDLARVAAHRCAVPGGHSIAQVERVEQRADQAQLEARQLAGSPLELRRALLGHEQLAEQVLHVEEHQREQRDRPDPEPVVEVGDADRQARRGHLGGQHRHEHRAHLRQERAAVERAVVDRDHREVEDQRDHEDPEHREVEGAVSGGQMRAVAERVEADAHGERERGVGGEVVEKGLPRLVPAQPADQDRGHGDQRRRRAAEEHHRQYQGEEAAGDPDPAAHGQREHVARHRERQQHREQPEIPVGAPGAEGGHDRGRR